MVPPQESSVFSYRMNIVQKLYWPFVYGTSHGPKAIISNKFSLCVMIAQCL